MGKLSELLIVSDELQATTQTIMDKVHSVVKTDKVSNLISWNTFLENLNIELKNMLNKIERGASIDGKD